MFVSAMCEDRNGVENDDMGVQISGNGRYLMYVDGTLIRYIIICSERT